VARWRVLGLFLHALKQYYRNSRFYRNTIYQPIEYAKEFHHEGVNPTYQQSVSWEKPHRLRAPVYDVRFCILPVRFLARSGAMELF
jgi:hypothetical protein